MDFRYRIMQFMSGRYGPDELFYSIFAVSVACSVINIFLRSAILQLVVYALIVYAVFRMLSRKTEARRRENAWYLEKVRFFKHKKELRERRKADRCHVYKKCPACRAILRLPRRVGIHRTICPKCGKEFTVKVKDK